MIILPVQINEKKAVADVNGFTLKLVFVEGSYTLNPPFNVVPGSDRIGV